MNIDTAIHDFAANAALVDNIGQLSAFPQITAVRLIHAISVVRRSGLNYGNSI
jgi:hypothetical protein